MAQSVGEVSLDIVAGKNNIGSVVKSSMNECQDAVNKGSSGIGGALGKIGSVAGGIAKGVAVGVGVASTAVIGLGKQAVDAYGNYEQLVGGVETLFKENASTVIKNASNAYKTAGMSANAYMETVTGFSASLLQSVGGDTVKAAQKADMAITDMSDNANKMGTSMDMIQNAYQGFAKQNYTMLDNLKLGYGGTKSEMERLLADAQAISGVQYDISSYADVVDAIHVIQTEMGVTGTTAKEASSTIQGSISAMGASWQNLLTGLADPKQNLDQLLNNFVDSVITVGDNLIPRVGMILESITKLISSLAPKLVAEVPNIVSQLLPSVIQGAVSIINAIVQALPQLINAIVGMLPQFLSGIQQIFTGIIGALPSLMQTLVSQLPTLIPMLIDGIVSMIVSIANSFGDIIQPIIDNLPAIILSITNALLENLPALIEGCVNLIVALVGAMPQIIMALIQCIPQIIVSIVEALFTAMPILLEGIGTIFGEAWNVIVTVFSGAGAFFGNLFSGIINIVSPIFSVLGTIASTIWNGIQSIFSVAVGFFSTIFSGVVNTVSGIFSTIVNIASNIWGGIKSVFSVVVSFFSGIFSRAVNSIKSIFSAITGIFSGIWNGVKNIFAGVKNFFTNIFSGAVNGIKSIFSPIADFFSGIWKKITGIFSKVGEVVGNAINGVVSKAVNTVLSTACGIINGFISAINFAIGVINAIPGVSISKLSKLNVPQMEQGGVLKKGQIGLLEGNGAEAVVPLEKNTGWLTRIADMLDTKMTSRGIMITPPALENVKAGNNTEKTDNDNSKIDELIELIKKLIDKDNNTSMPIYIGNELIDEYILNKNSRTVLRSGGRA